MNSISSIFGEASSFVSQFGTVFAAIALVFCLLQCFFGYKLIKVWVAIIGFLIGFALGFGISSVAMGMSWITALIGIGAGILLALIAFKIYLLGVFIVAFVSLFGLVQSIPLTIEYADLILMILGIVAGIAGGILAVRFARPLIIIFTGLSGGIQSVTYLAVFSDTIAMNQNVRLILTAALVAIGILVQFVTTKSESNQNKKKRTR